MSSHQARQNYRLGTTSPGRSVPPHQIARAVPGRQGHLTDTLSLGRSVPPHWVTSVPSPGHQGRLTGAAGASPISPAGGIPPPRESSAPCAASVACRVRRRAAATHPLSLGDCAAGRHRYFPSVSLVSSSLPREALPTQSPAMRRGSPCWQEAGPAAQEVGLGQRLSGERRGGAVLLNLGKTSTSLGTQWALFTWKLLAFSLETFS